MDPFAPAAIHATLTKLAMVESAARAIHAWIDRHVTASDVLPRRMNTEVAGLFETLGSALNEAKELARDMDELATTAAMKAIQRAPLTEQERKYLKYIGVLRPAPENPDTSLQAAT